VLAMIPGAGQMKGLEADERKLTHLEAIIDSMTPLERRRPDLIDGRRRRRIARGSGTSVQQVNQLLRQFAAMCRMMKAMRGGKAAEAALARRLGLSRLP